MKSKAILLLPFGIAVLFIFVLNVKVQKENEEAIQEIFFSWVIDGVSEGFSKYPKIKIMEVNKATLLDFAAQTFHKGDNAEIVPVDLIGKIHPLFPRKGHLTTENNQLIFAFLEIHPPSGTCVFTSLKSLKVFIKQEAVDKYVLFVYNYFY